MMHFLSHCARALSILGCLWAANFNQAAPAFGQSAALSSLNAATVLGGTPGSELPDQNSKFGGTGSAIKRHLAPSGRPCITVSAFSSPQVVNSAIFDQTVLLDNQCNQPIKLRICYYKTDRCQDMSIAGYSRKQQILGIFANKSFRYEFKEIFAAQ